MKLKYLLFTLCGLFVLAIASKIPFPATKSGNQSLDQSIRLAKDWYLNDINPDTGLLNYLYDPRNDTYSTNNNHVRQLASLWTLTELRNYTGDKNLDKLINKTFDYYLKYQVQKENYSYLDIDDPKISYNAFLIMALINSSLPDRDQLAKELADAILALQRGDGSYSTSFTKDTNDAIDYYPGEAMLALIKLYESTHDQRYLESVQKAFPYYKKTWQERKNSAMVPWHTQAYYLLYRNTQDPQIPPFIFEMNNWVIDNYQGELGGFPKNDPRNLTSFMLEGLVDAYALAKSLGDTQHIRSYENSVNLARDFVLRSQYTKADTLMLKHPARAIGGFKASLKDPRIRVDYTQHAVMALIKLQRP